MRMAWSERKGFGQVIGSYFVRLGDSSIWPALCSICPPTMRGETQVSWSCAPPVGVDDRGGLQTQRGEEQKRRCLPWERSRRKPRAKKRRTATAEDLRDTCRQPRNAPVEWEAGSVNRESCLVAVRGGEIQQEIDSSTARVRSRQMRNGRATSKGGCVALPIGPAWVWRHTPLRRNRILDSLLSLLMI